MKRDREPMLKIPVAEYKHFLEHGEQGREALLDYLHIAYSFIRQGTTGPLAQDEEVLSGMRLNLENGEGVEESLRRLGILHHVLGTSGGGST